MVCLGEQVGVGVEGDAGVGVAELAADEDDVEAVGDQQGGEGVAEGVERESFPVVGDPGAFDGLAEGFAYVAVVTSAPDRVGEDEVVGFLCELATQCSQ